MPKNLGTITDDKDLSTKEYVDGKLASPTFTGTPAAPTASVGTNTTQLATTAFVQAQLPGGFGRGTGTNSVEEGIYTTASGNYSHAEGSGPCAIGDYCHAEGRFTLAMDAQYIANVISYSGSTLTVDTVTGFVVDDVVTIMTNSSAYNIQTATITAINGLVVTLNMTANANMKTMYKKRVSQTFSSHSEGTYTVAVGRSAHAEGNSTIASGTYAHAEGYGSIASGSTSHAQGGGTLASGFCSHAEGGGTVANNTNAHAEGGGTLASGDSSHAEGNTTTASGMCSHSEGDTTTASGDSSHAEGTSNTASGNYSHVSGISNQSRYAQTVIGQYATISTASDTVYSATNELFIIGNGTGTGARGNAFKVLGNGSTYADGAYASTGADYAEYFEWEDGNPDGEDRVGYFVTLEGDKIRKTVSINDYILGVVSATPSVVGDNYEAWQGKYVTDDWGRVQYHDVFIPTTYNILHHEAVYEDDVLVEAAYDEPVVDMLERVEHQPIYNPEWDSTQEYIPREKRKEWSPVGMMGKLLVRDDGNCLVNGYCTANDDGLATVSPTGYRVMKRISVNIIQILLV